MPARRLPSVSLAAPGGIGAADAVVIGLVETSAGPRLAAGSEPLAPQLQRQLGAALAALGATGRPDEVLKIPTLGLAEPALVVTTGLGAPPHSGEAIRRATGAALRALDGVPRVRLCLDGPLGCLAEGALFGTYRCVTYGIAPKPGAPRTITIPVETAGAADRAELRRARSVAEAVNLTRDLVNEPANLLYPDSFARRTVELATSAGVEAEVLDEIALRRERFGALLAVGSGSARPPRLVRLHYRPRRPRGHVALVGKGITFDAGGLNLKTEHQTWMKSDMGGAAAVVASTLAAARLRIPLAISATVPMAENMPSGTAYRPSDVLILRNGRTVEVANTDAEGRLVLADAISRAVEDHPDYVIDVATLTGAQIVALGTRLIGVMGTAQLRALIVGAAEECGEGAWPMPLPPEVRAGIDSQIADLRNLSTDIGAGMLVGGAFVGDFVPDGLPWAHLDIAGPSLNRSAPHGYTPVGGTGAGVRTLIATLERIAAG